MFPATIKKSSLKFLTGIFKFEILKADSSIKVLASSADLQQMKHGL
jgi:hypothetical protein